MRIEGFDINPRTITPPTTPQKAESMSFADVLSKGLERVHELQADADAHVLQLAAGEADDLHNVVAAVEKASLALELTIALRNKLVEAYQEIMRMQV